MDTEQIAKSYSINTSARLGRGKMGAAYEMIGQKVVDSRLSLSQTGVIEQIKMNVNEIKMLGTDS